MLRKKVTFNLPPEDEDKKRSSAKKISSKLTHHLEKDSFIRNHEEATQSENSSMPISKLLGGAAIIALGLFGLHQGLSRLSEETIESLLGSDHDSLSTHPTFDA